MGYSLPDNDTGIFVRGHWLRFADDIDLLEERRDVLQAYASILNKYLTLDRIGNRTEYQHRSDEDVGVRSRTDGGKHRNNSAGLL